MPHLILVVDDEYAFCEVVCEILEAAGYRARKASHVSEAYKCLSEETPDLILTDVMMPDVDGLTFIRELRAQSKYASIPMVVVSARASPSDQREAMEAGATQILAKPFSSNHLEELVHSLLESG
jgi:CheY-like chemotaxis protein